MRCLLPLLLLLVACGSPAPPAPVPSPTPAAGIDAIRARGVLRFGTENHSPPMYFLGAEGRTDGFEHRLMHAIAEEMGLKAEIVPVTWSSHVAAVKNGVVDAVVAGWIPNEQVGMGWSAPYLESGLCLVVPKGSPVRGVSGLAGKRVGLYIDPVAEAWAAEALQATTRVAVEDGYFDLLAAGELDALVYDYPFTVGEIALHADTARIVQLNLFPFTYAAMLRPDDIELKAAFDSAIAAVRARPEYTDWMREFLVVGDSLSGVLDLDPPERIAGARVHTVVQGETLRTVAARHYGEEARWKDLWRANKAVVALPDLLPTGTELVVP
jgi:ABC-type amino acid transport substrate-binding protein